ncbi:MAG: isoleucine--tRNA ligase [Ruminococcaceae bacterium]|nr:isoleucine--tRNA ligase [Oscillospiraceae bacterium]
MSTDFTKSLNLPKTDFSMKANLPNKEPLMQEKWMQEDLYGRLMEKNAGKPHFIFHDGPPYANGNIHLGHALNKLLKDFIIKYKNMSGFNAPYIHGWDTHGLPIENQMIKKHGVKRNEMDTATFRKKCGEFAKENADKQKAQMQRLGVIGDWDNSYYTIIPEFEEQQIRIFGEMAKNGYIYKGMKPVYWCAKDETALAEAEIEYSEDECDSIYVKFALTDDCGKIKSLIGSTDNVYFVIWTTTTWTLPANLAICLGPEFEYSFVKHGDNVYIIASELVESVASVCALDGFEIIGKMNGAEFEGMKAQHPFVDRVSHIIVGDHVTLESGTGCVHTAPGHGVEDFEICRKYDYIGMTVPVDSHGRMNEEAGKYCGLTTDEANKAILEDIRESGALLATQRIIHQYPHCWRCKSPIVFRATEQWFCSIEGFRQKALDAIKDVKWIPSWGEVRLENMVKDRNDWCISRQRTWGVPIPIFYCEDCGEPLLNETTIDRIATLFGKEGSNAWFEKSVEEIIGDAAVCPKCGGHHMRKETDIMDVWFDSGSSYAYVLKKFYNDAFPCDLYLEGNDQYRGWFQSSLLTAVATRGSAPYKTVLTHGMIIDLEGRKMSKSLGNGIDPADVIKNFGADILRLWVSSVDYTNDVKISNEILKQLSEIYRKIRNTARIILANLGDGTDFNPDTDMVDIDKLPELDKWALSRLNKLVANVREAYESYQFHLIYHYINNFCTIDMSKLYIDITKDRVYVDKKDGFSRRSAQTVMYLVLNALTRMLAPLLAFTSEEIWAAMPHSKEDDTRSVLLNDMPLPKAEYAFDEIEERWNTLFNLRDDVMKALEIARADKMIGKSLDAKVTIYTTDKTVKETLASFADELAPVFIVSQAYVKEEEAPENAFAETANAMKVLVEKAEGVKCDRCWNYTSDCKEVDGLHICARCAEIVGLN